jgi:hypothetical protein
MKMALHSGEDVAIRSSVAPGNRILARWNGGTFWFPGTADNISGTMVTVQYDDGMSDIRPKEQVRPFDWRIGSRIDALWSGNGQWYAATITSINRHGTELGVRFDDGICEDRPSAFCRSD